MNVELSYDKEFGELLEALRAKYGAAIFELEGIGSQLDLNKFSKEFFGTKITADASIDDNSNVGDSTVVSYSTVCILCGKRCEDYITQMWLIILLKCTFLVIYIYMIFIVLISIIV